MSLPDLVEATRRRGQAVGRRLRPGAAGPRVEPDGGRTRRRARRARRNRAVRRVRATYELVSVPFLTAFLLHDRAIRPEYGLTWRRKVALVRQMRRTTRNVETGTSYRAHVAMAAKILSIPSSTPGVIVEAGCWKGGTTANLSLVAEIVGRDLIVYDSFEGLPPPAEGDNWAHDLGEGAFRGELDEVRSNVARWGAIERCRFRKGWFSDTLGSHTEPVVAAFADVDHQASMHQCLLGLWPHLVDDGYFFVDEYTRLDYCALFFSERFWRTYFDRPPPGLMGAGTGVALGQYFVGPYRTRPPLQEPSSIGWTRKDFYAAWDYWPDEDGSVPLAGGGVGSAHGRDGWVTTTVSTEEHAEHGLERHLASDPKARRRFNDRLLNTEKGQRDLIEAMNRTEEGRRKLAEAIARQSGAEAQDR